MYSLQTCRVALKADDETTEGHKRRKKETGRETKERKRFRSTCGPRAREPSKGKGSEATSKRYLWVPGCGSLGLAPTATPVFAPPSLLLQFPMPGVPTARPCCLSVAAEGKRKHSLFRADFQLPVALEQKPPGFRRERPEENGCHGLICGAAGRTRRCVVKRGLVRQREPSLADSEALQEMLHYRPGKRLLPREWSVTRGEA